MGYLGEKLSSSYKVIIDQCLTSVALSASAVI